MLKNLVIVIKATQDFVRHVNDNVDLNAAELNHLFESISDIYIPLLNMLERMENDGVIAKFALVLPPVLCNLLADTVLQEQYIEWLDKRIELGKVELERNASDERIVENIKRILDNNEQLKADFTEKYNKDLLKFFLDYKNKGYVELLATCGTDVFVPHYADMKEVLSAQVETGLHAFRQNFGEIPDGFWLPELGYTPGIEKIIKAYGFTYTILDARAFLLSNTIPSTGTFYPVRTENSLILFASNCESHDKVFGEEGYINNKVYCNKNRDIGFELKSEELSLVLREGTRRFTTGYSYFNKDFDNNENSIYDFEAAKKQVNYDAKAFIADCSEKLSSVAKEIPEKQYAVMVCTFDAQELKDKWSEGFLWIEQILRNTPSYNVNMTTCNTMISEQYQLEKIEPYYSAQCGWGYGENLLSSKNCWMMRYIRKACERMIDLSDRFPTDTGLKTRLLNLGAKELLIAQSCNLAKILDSDEPTEYAERRFKDSIEAFTAVFDSLGSNTVSTEWLTNLEVCDSLFPWMNYRIFTKKR